MLESLALAASVLLGTWVNEAGSAVTLVEEEDGRLSGHYRTELGAPDAGDGFPLTGWVQGDQLAFAVDFAPHGSLTSWTGQMSEDADGPFIRTLWHLTRDVPDEAEAEDLWGSIVSGYAVFRPASRDAGTAGEE